MARRSGLGAFVRTVQKISRDIDRINRANERESMRAQHEREREARATVKERERESRERAKELKAEAREKAIEARENAQELRRQMRDDAKSERAAKKKQKDGQRAAKQAEKEREAYLEMISEELHPMTELEFGLGKIQKRQRTRINDWSLKRDFSYVESGKKQFTARLGGLRVDALVFSGAYNSVVGVDGLLAFKKAIEALKISYDDKHSTQEIQGFLDYVFVALVQTGTYIVSGPSEAFSKDSWITAFRYILVHENSINTSNSRAEILQAFEDFKIPDEAQDLFSKNDIDELRNRLVSAAAQIIESVSSHLVEKNSRRFITRGA